MRTLQFISLPLVPLWAWCALYVGNAASVAFCLATVAFYLLKDVAP
ncbi:MAG TPA: hypothetical protein VK898_06960 [Chloroflexota bacterium]|nr:hypothetical protein [Chloroflexota bacterium]